MRNNLSTPLIIQSRTILYYYTSKLLLPSKSPLFAYKLVCIEQPGRPGCNKRPMPNSPMIVKIYMNYSPCGDCAKWLIKHLTQWVNDRTDIYAAGLYFIKRKSCENHHPTDHSLVDSSCSGFKQLLKYGQNNGNINVQTFDIETWKQLIDLLKACSAPLTNTVSYQYDGIIVPEVRCLYKNHTRANEDILMRQDLNSLIEECNVRVEAITQGLQAVCL